MTAASVDSGGGSEEDRSGTQPGSGASDICRSRSDDVSAISGSDTGVDAGAAASSNLHTATADSDPADTEAAAMAADMALGTAIQGSGDAGNGVAVEAGLKGAVSGTGHGSQRRPCGTGGMLSEFMDFMIVGWLTEETEKKVTIADPAVHVEAVVESTAADTGSGGTKEANMHGTEDMAVEQCSAADSAGTGSHAEPEDVADGACLESELLADQLPESPDTEACAALGGVEEVSDSAQEHDQGCEEVASWQVVDDTGRPCGEEDMLEEEDPQPLELPEVLEEPVLAESEPPALPEPWPEAQAAEEDEPADACASGTYHTPVSTNNSTEHASLYQLGCADGLNERAVDICGSDSQEQPSQAPAPSTESAGAETPSVDAVPMSLAYNNGTGRETRESEVAEAMVDEVLEETLATMLSADARGFAQN